MIGYLKRLWARAFARPKMVNVRIAGASLGLTSGLDLIRRINGAAPHE